MGGGAAQGHPNQSSGAGSTTCYIDRDAQGGQVDKLTVTITGISFSWHLSEAASPDACRNQESRDVQISCRQMSDFGWCFRRHEPTTAATDKPSNSRSNCGPACHVKNNCACCGLLIAFICRGLIIAIPFGLVCILCAEWLWLFRERSLYMQRIQLRLQRDT